MTRDTKLVEPEILRRAIGRQLRQAQPAHAHAQPGDVRRRRRLRAHDGPVLQGPRLVDDEPERVRRARRRCSCGSPCCSRTSPRRSPKAAARRRPTRCARRGPRRSRTVRRPDGTIEERRRAPRSTSATSASSTAGEVDPERRRGHRGHRERRRVGDHRRVGAGDPRVRRRPLGGHRRHPRALRRDRRAHHGSSRARRSSTG